MKINAIKTLGLSDRGMDEVEIDHVEAIVHDEFLRKFPFGNKPTQDYRSRGIDRIVRANLSLYNNCNITFELLQRYVTVKCPYCSELMTYHGGGGNGNTSTGEYKCKCGAEAHLSFDNNGALGFSPK